MAQRKVISISEPQISGFRAIFREILPRKVWRLENSNCKIFVARQDIFSFCEKHFVTIAKVFRFRSLKMAEN